jgi:hypothetical protein
MFPVEIRVSHEATLMRIMQQMREWLDHQHYETTVFRSETSADGLTIRVHFRGQQAMSFASQFSGVCKRLISTG